MTKHRSHSAAFKRQVAQEFIAGETLHGLSKRHDLSRQLIRIWVGKYEAGALETMSRPPTCRSMRPRSRRSSELLCTCSDKPLSIFDVIIRVEGGDFARAAAWLTLPSCLASSSSPTFARIIFWSWVICRDFRPASETNNDCQVKFELMQFNAVDKRSHGHVRSQGSV
jgi:transposase-like protein